jgi:hypothetical protein
MLPIYSPFLGLESFIVLPARKQKKLVIENKKMLAEKSTEFYTMDTRTISSGLNLAQAGLKFSWVQALNPALLSCLLFYVYLS